MPSPQRPASPHLLTFPPFQLTIRLEGFPDRLARFLAHQWLAEIRPAGEDAGGYRIRLALNRQIRVRRLTRGAGGQIAIRHRRLAEEDELRVGGGRVRIAPGRAGAEVEVHPDVLASPAAFEPISDAALGHALAIQGAALLHGAAFRVFDHPVLALGRTGCGKSTLAAAALACRGQVVSDDSLILGRREGNELTVRPLRRDVFLSEESLQVLPARNRNRCERFALSGHDWCLRRERFPSSFLDSLKPEFVLKIRKDRRLRDFSLLPLDQASVLAALLDATSPLYLMDPRYEEEQRSLLPLFVQLAESAPAWEARIGTAILDRGGRLMADLFEKIPKRASSTDQSSG